MNLDAANPLVVEISEMNFVQREQTPYDKEDPACEILKSFLYIGSDDTATNLAELQRCNIGHILNMAQECHNHYEHIPHANLRYCRANLIDHFFEENFYPFIPIGIQFIESSRDKAVLVHCSAGVSRSSAMVLAYLMWKKGMTFKHAYQFLKATKDMIDPKNFMQDLQEFENYLKHIGHYESAMYSRTSNQVFVPTDLPQQIPRIKQEDFDYEPIVHHGSYHSQQHQYHQQQQPHQFVDYKLASLQPPPFSSDRSGDRGSEIFGQAPNAPHQLTLMFTAPPSQPTSPQSRQSAVRPYNNALHYERPADAMDSSYDVTAAIHTKGSTVDAAVHVAKRKANTNQTTSTECCVIL